MTTPTLDQAGAASQVEAAPARPRVRWSQLVALVPGALGAVAAVAALLRFGLYFADESPGDVAWLLVDLSASLMLVGWGALRVWQHTGDGIGHLLQGSGLAWGIACLAEGGAVHDEAWTALDGDVQLIAHLVARSLLFAAAVVVLPDRSSDRFMRRGPLDAAVAGVTVVSLVLPFVESVDAELRLTSFGFGNRAWIEVGQQVPVALLFALLVVHTGAAAALAWTRRGLPPTSFQVIGWVLAVAAIPLAIPPVARDLPDGVLDLTTLFVFPALPVLSVISITRAIAAGARTVNELRRVQRDMVEAVETERRRLRRELHDGLGPALAGVALGVRAAGSQVVATEPQAAEFLGQLGDEIDNCVDEVRRIINDLRPPALDQLGLAGAIAAQVHRVCGDRLALSLDLGDLESADVGAAVELAALRIVSEAVTNVARHAEATTCAVRGRVERDGVTLEVEDDGRGLPLQPRVGVGLVSMRERAAAVGGEVTVGSGPRGGTLVRVWLRRQGR